MDNLLKKRQNFVYEEKKKENLKKLKIESDGLSEEIIFDEEEDSKKNEYSIFDERRKKEKISDLKDKNIHEILKYGESIGIKNKKSHFDSDNDKSEKEDLENNKKNLITIFKEKNLFYPNLTLDQNFLLLLLQDYFVDKNGFLLNEISEKLSLKNKKKFLSRYIQNWINTGIIDAVPFRDGKNFFKIIKINPRKIPKYIKEICSKKNIKPINKINEEESKLINLIQEIYFGENNHKQNKNIFYLEKNILKHILNIIKQNINDNLLSHLKNQNLNKIFNFLQKNFQELNKINLDQYDFVSKKFLSFFLEKKYLIFEIPETGKKRKKLRTETRLNRIIYILTIIKEKNYLSFRDLSLSIEKNLENEKNFKIDKKTLLRILNDIEECKLIKLKKFLVTFKQKNSYNPFENFKQTKIFIIEKDFEISDEKLEGEKYIENPFYRENMKKAEKAKKAKKENLYIFDEDYNLKKEINKNQRYFDFFEMMKVIKEKIMFRKFKEFLIEKYIFFLIDKEISKIEKKLFLNNFEIIEKMINDLNLENGLGFDNIEYNDFSNLKNYFYPEECFFNKKYLIRISFFTKKLFSFLKKNVYWNLEDLKNNINSERLLKVSIDYLIEKKKIEIKIHNNKDFLIKYL